MQESEDEMKWLGWLVSSHSFTHGWVIPMWRRNLHATKVSQLFYQ